MQGMEVAVKCTVNVPAAFPVQWPPTTHWEFLDSTPRRWWELEAMDVEGEDSCYVWVVLDEHQVPSSMDVLTSAF